MPEDARRTEFVENLGGSLAQMGFPRMPARVFALLLAAPEDTLTARELADERIEGEFRDDALRD
jgi:hypothetical protein